MTEINLSTIRTWLQETLRHEPIHLVALRGGEWSQAFAYDVGERRLVIRFGRFAEDFYRDRVASQFTTPDLPIPRVVLFGEAFDGHFCLSERKIGGMIDDLDADGMRRIVPAFLRMLDGIRGANIAVWRSEFRGADRPWRDRLLAVDEESDRVSGWHDRMRESPFGSEAYETALTAFRSLVGECPDAEYLVHNDLLHYNVLVDEDRITGVIDWGNAMIGDFLYDLAMYTFYAPRYPAMKGIDWRGAALSHYQTIGLDVPNFDQRLRCYEMHLGLSGMAYSAFKQNWPEFEANARRTAALQSG